MRRTSGRRGKKLAFRSIAIVGTTALFVGAASASAVASPGSTGWPSHPSAAQYVQTPSSTHVKPVAVVSTSGDVSGAKTLIAPSSGRTATLTATPTKITSSAVTETFPAVQARYVRLDVTKLGLPPAGDSAGVYTQLSELQVFGSVSTTDLAQGKIVTASETIEAAGWGEQYLTDGVTNSNNAAAHGWTSDAHPSTDVSASPVWVTVDLGSVQSVSSVVLWPRTDTLSPDGQTASFPVDFTVQTSATDSQSPSFAVQKAVTDQPDPAIPVTTGPASIVLDYGHEVGGYPTFNVASETGSPTLEGGYSETKTQIGPTGDGVSPWASGDPNRYDTYTVDKPGLITNSQIQGGERYEEITLTTPGTVSLSAAGIDYTPYIPKASTRAGSFLSSSDELNKLWYDGSYTAEVNQLPVGTTAPRWNTDNGSLDVPGTTAGTGYLTAGTKWTDYTASFDTKITTNQAGWMVREQNATTGYLFILDASNDTATGPGPSYLQELADVNGTYTTIANVPLTTPVDPTSWHAIKEVVSGTTVTTSIDGTKIASFDTASASPAIPSLSTGSVGFREFSGEEASFKDLAVTAATKTLYSNALTQSSSIKDFSLPGSNTVPLIVDGAKRDRAVWSGDLAVEGPTLFYSSGSSDYIRGSLQLLGSYAGSNGYVSGDMPPQTPINTGPAPATTQNAYSASYSMYFVRDLALYYQYTADRSFVKQELPIVEKELAWSATQVDSNGLFATTSADGADWDYYDGDKTGEVTAYNALYYQALIDGQHLETAAGNPELAAHYAAQASTLKAKINATLFNTTTGVYELSNTDPGVVAQDANAYAIEYGVAPANKVVGILAALKSTLWTTNGSIPYSTSAFSNIMSPYVTGAELNARFGSGDTANAVTLLENEWGPMIEPGDLYTGTFWENESTSGTQGGGNTSMAHGWSTSPTSVLSEYVLGIQPVAAGYKTWSVRPQPGTLSWTEGQAPTPHGALAVKWSHNTKARTFAMNVQAPKGTSGTISVPTFGSRVDVVVNGHTVWSNGRAVGGKNHLAATSDGAYVNVKVGSGSFSISTRASR
ncbi:MAG: alpha-L-rhamnosidase [Frondihabitans sp.]|nr:alpha-L-rhamnosidase [Frondihabitans sp.]